MVSLQNRRALGLLLYLIIMLASCRSIETDKSYKSIKTLISENETAHFNNFMVVSPVLCKGCVEDKFIEYVNDSDSTLISQTVIIMDTTMSNLYHILDPQIHPVIHVTSGAIDKAFPKIANVCIFKKDTEQNRFSQKVVNADDSSLVYYLKSRLD